jgi:hypothetical protein
MVQFVRAAGTGYIYRGVHVHFDENSRVQCCSPDSRLDLVCFTDGLQYLKFSPEVTFGKSKYFYAHGCF